MNSIYGIDMLDQVNESEMAIWKVLKKKWFNKEYSKLARILIPELREQDKQKRADKAKNINEQMTKLLSEKKCQCGGDYKQSRSGSKVAYCESCKKRVMACETKK